MRVNGYGLLLGGHRVFLMTNHRSWVRFGAGAVSVTSIYVVCGVFYCNYDGVVSV